MIDAPACARCRFFLEGEHWIDDRGHEYAGSADGYCRRFPKTEDKDAGQWCGEFKPAAPRSFWEWLEQDRKR